MWPFWQNNDEHLSVGLARHGTPAMHYCWSKKSWDVPQNTTTASAESLFRHIRKSLCGICAGVVAVFRWWDIPFAEKWVIGLAWKRIILMLKLVVDHASCAFPFCRKATRSYDYIYGNIGWLLCAEVLYG